MISATGTATATAPCPCGSGARYAACCGPLHDGEPAASAEALMRSRFAAFALGLDDYLLRSWHARTRPAALDTAADGIRWRSLEILDVVDGGPDDAAGEVEFLARGEGPDGPIELRERSRFVRRGGRWQYLDGELG